MRANRIFMYALCRFNALRQVEKIDKQLDSVSVEEKEKLVKLKKGLTKIV